MNSNIFIDSSLLVEYIKGRKTELLTELIGNKLAITFINETVVSEFMLYFLAHFGQASPRSLKSSEKIPKLLSDKSGFDLLKKFEFLATGDSLFKLVPELMKKYNFLPNDAIILATCKIHGITKLASHDSDFKTPCEAEGIELLTEN